MADQLGDTGQRDVVTVLRVVPLPVGVAADCPHWGRISRTQGDEKPEARPGYPTHQTETRGRPKTCRGAENPTSDWTQVAGTTLGPVYPRKYFQGGHRPRAGRVTAGPEAHGNHWASCLPSRDRIPVDLPTSGHRSAVRMRTRGADQVAVSPPDTRHSKVHPGPPLDSATASL